MPKINASTSPDGPRVYQCAESGAVPSVTEILRVCEGNWINSYIARVGRREADRAKEEAAVLGTRVHALAARLALDPAHKPEPDMKSFAIAIRGFLKTHVRRVIDVELSLVNEVLGFGGTLDLYCELQDSSFAVVDLKTAAGGLTRIHGLQLSGYALLLKESGRTVNKRIAVRLHKSPGKVGNWYARSYSNHREDTKAFLAAKTLWWFLHGNRLKKAQSA